MSRMEIRRRELLAAALAVLGLSAHPLDQSAPSVRWGIDYGAATVPAVARSFDLLVLEPDHPRPVAPLRGPASRLLGYISLGEVERGRPFAAELEAAGALRAPNPNWPDARLVDLRHPAWASLVLDRLIPDILASGYDGIFMDTLDNAAALEAADPVANRSMVDRAAELVLAIRARFPAIVLMMNRGYAVLPQVAPQIEFVLGEAMASRWNFGTGGYEMTPAEDWAWQAERLRAARQINPKLILATLDYWDSSDLATVTSLYARERAAGFHPYVATLALDRLLPEPGP